MTEDGDTTETEETDGVEETEDSEETDEAEEAGEAAPTDEERLRGFEEELDHLKVDLALKDTYALELSAALTEREKEVAALTPALAEAKKRLAEQEAELDRLRAAVVQAQVQLEEITTRASYRILVRATGVLERHDGLRRAATGLARRLSRPG